MKKVISAIVLLVILCTLSSCGTAETAVTEPIEPAEIKTVEPPESGWTLEQLNKVLYLNGQQIQLPLMFSSLKDGYEIRNKTYNDVSSLDSNIVGGNLYYENNLICMVAFCEMENDIEILSMAFFRDYYKDSQDISKYISINGFGLQSDINEIYSCLGNEYINESELLIYNITDSDYIISVPNINDFGISLRILNKENYDVFN